MGRFFKTSLPEFTDRPVLSTAPLELIADTQTAVVDKQAKALDHGTTLINMLAQMPHMKVHDPIIKEKLDEVTKELQGLFQEMDKNPMSSHQTLQKALLYGQDLVKELTTGDFKTITDSYNTNNKGLTTNQNILAEDYYAQPIYQASLRKYAANMRDDKGKLKPYEFPYLAPTPDLMGGLAIKAKEIPLMERIQLVGNGPSYDKFKERTEQDILKSFYDNPDILKQYIDPQARAIDAYAGYYDNNLAEEYARNYDYKNAITLDKATGEYSINPDMEGTVLGNALQHALSKRETQVTRQIITQGGGGSYDSTRTTNSKTAAGLSNKPDGTVVKPIKSDYKTLNSNPDVAYTKGHKAAISNREAAATTKKPKKPKNIEAQKVQIYTGAKALFETLTNKEQYDSQVFYNLLSGFAFEYVDRDKRLFDEIMDSFVNDEFFVDDAAKLTKAKMVKKFEKYSTKDGYDLLFQIRRNALTGNVRKELETYIEYLDYYDYNLANYDFSKYFANISSAEDTFNEVDTFEEMIYALEKRTGQLGTDFYDAYNKTRSSLVSVFPLEGTDYPVAVRGDYSEKDVETMDKSSIVINGRINFNSKPVSDETLFNFLFTKEGIEESKPSFSYTGCTSGGAPQYLVTVTDEDKKEHTFEITDKNDLITKIYGWDFTDIANTPFLDIDNKSQTEALFDLWKVQLGKKIPVSSETYYDFVAKSIDTEKTKASANIEKQVLDSEATRRRYLISKDKLLSADFIANNTGTKLRDVSGNTEFEKAKIITKEVEYKGITDILTLVFDENYTPYSVIEKGGKVYIKSLSAYLDDRITTEAEEKILNIYNHAVESSK